MKVNHFALRQNLAYEFVIDVPARSLRESAAHSTPGEGCRQQHAVRTPAQNVANERLRLAAASIMRRALSVIVPHAE